jgi:hypothetical protein
MTQTLARPGTYMNTVPARVSDRVQMAQTVGYRDHGGVRLYRYDLVSVEDARVEFPDPIEFVGNTTCQECGIAACELVECFGCGAKGCACLIREGDHDRHDWCEDCTRPCYGRCCTDDR